MISVQSLEAKAPSRPETKRATAELKHISAFTSVGGDYPLHSGALVAQWLTIGWLTLWSWVQFPKREISFFCTCIYEGNINTIWLHTVFHNHLSVMLIWLKYFWKGCKLSSYMFIHYISPFSMPCFKLSLTDIGYRHCLKIKSNFHNIILKFHRIIQTSANRFSLFISNSFYKLHKPQV